MKAAAVRHNAQLAFVLVNMFYPIESWRWFSFFHLKKDFQSIPLPESKIKITIVTKIPFPNYIATSLCSMKVF